MAGAKSTLEGISNLVIAAAAVAIAGVVTTREFRQRDPSGIQKLETRAIPESAWDSLLSVARSRTLEEPRMKVAVVVDVECPFCRSYHHTVDSLLKAIPRVGVAIVNFPLTQHRYALVGAKAIDCARPEGKQYTLLGLAYASQDTLSSVDWAQLASSAGVSNVSGFTECLSSNDTEDRVFAERDLVRTIGARATPTVIVDGKILSRPASLAELKKLLR